MGFFRQDDKKIKINAIGTNRGREKIKINKYPPYGILWEGMTSDVGGIKGGVQKIDLRFYKLIPNASISHYDPTC
jgi:hypothetical protein